MDPNETLKCLLDSLNEQNREEAIQALENLRDWLAKDGFIPRVEHVSEDDGIDTYKVGSNT